MKLTADTITDEQIRDLAAKFPLLITQHLIDGALGIVEPHRNHSRAEIARLGNGVFGLATYPLWCISINGGVWGNRSRSAADTIAEVQQIIDRAKESIAYLAKHAPRSDGHDSWLNKWVRFDDENRERWNLKPAVVEVEAGSTVHAKGPIIARWVGGERVL